MSTTNTAPKGLGVSEPTDTPASGTLLQRIPSLAIDWRMVFERSPVPGMLVDAHTGVCLAINREACNWFKVQADDFVGRSSIDLNVWPDPSLRERAMAHTRETGFLRNFEAEVVARGKVRTVLLNMELLNNSPAASILVSFIDISLHKALERQLRQLALHDSVTGLPNRTLLSEHLGHAFTLANRHERKVGLLFIDLDHFKAVNDRYGHETGDHLLKVIAQRLSGCLRASDLASRLGGDEFVVVAEDLHEPAEALVVAEKIITELGRPFMADGHEITIGASVGIAIYPDHAADADTLLRYADQALYTSKSQGRNTSHLWQAPTSHSPE
jgi:diguanylate cyclase (GGDEF)-like protein/PAS domain S-box-containing protein